MSTAGGVFASLMVAAVAVAAIAFVALRSRYVPQLVTALVVRGVVAGVMFAELGLWAPDAQTYHTWAKALTLDWTGERIIGPETAIGKDGFPTILAGMYTVLGAYPVVGLVLNVAVGALTVPVLASAADRLRGGTGARAGWIAAMFPPLVLWSSLLLREAITWLLLAITAHALIGLANRAKGRDSLHLVLALVGLLWMRGTVALVVGVAAVAGLLLVGRVGARAIAACAILVVGARVFADRIAAISSGYDLDRINAVRGALRTEARTGFEVVDFADPGAVFRSFPGLFIRTVLGPFPWEWGAVGFLGMLDAILWLIALFWAYRGVRRLGWGRIPLVLGAPAAALLVALALTSGNYGTMQRLRIQALVMVVPVAAAGIGRHPDAGDIAQTRPRHHSSGGRNPRRRDRRQS